MPVQPQLDIFFSSGDGFAGLLRFSGNVSSLQPQQFLAGVAIQKFCGRVGIQDLGGLQIHHHHGIGLHLEEPTIPVLGFLLGGFGLLALFRLRGPAIQRTL